MANISIVNNNFLTLFKMIDKSLIKFRFIEQFRLYFYLNLMML